jgi:hypothetical protein
VGAIHHNRQLCAVGGSDLAGNYARSIDNTVSALLWPMAHPEHLQAVDARRASIRCGDIEIDLSEPLSPEDDE